jgi:TRAP-type uncharacterized transport system substrate-binding protein
MRNSSEIELLNTKDEKIDYFNENQQKTIKITIDEDIYRKLKSFGVLLGINDKEPILLGNTISKLYDLSKDKIFKEFI